MGAAVLLQPRRAEGFRAGAWSARGHSRKCCGGFGLLTVAQCCSWAAGTGERLSRSSWERTAELIREKRRGQRLHARSWEYEPNPLLLLLSSPTAIPPLGLCGSVPVLAAVLIVMGHLVLKSLFKRGKSLPRVTAAALHFSPGWK